MKKTAITLLLFLLVMAFGTTQLNIFAGQMTQSLRVGLSPYTNGVDSISITNKTINIGYENGGQFIVSVQLTADSSFVFSPDNGYYLRQEQTFSNYAACKAYTDTLNASGLPAIPGLTATAWAAYIGPYGTQAETATAQSVIAATVLPVNNKRVTLKDGSRPAMLFDNETAFPQISSDDGFIQLGEKKYRGRLELARPSGKKLIAINVISLNEYLYSVVPSEMPAGWHTEALKAQVCAARSYTITSLKNHEASGYHLCDTIHCQLYQGIGSEKESSTKAVDETNGIVPYYNGEPICATFFSSSGGKTENSEDVWPNALPYLRSVAEINEQTPKEWTRVITLQELGILLQSKKINIGSVTGMFISNTGQSGRVSEVTITGTTGTKVLAKEETRTFFSGLNGGSLDSRNYVITSGTAKKAAIIPSILNIRNFLGSTGPEGYVIPPVPQQPSTPVVPTPTTPTPTTPTPTTPAPVGNGKDIVITGKGWGHGVGMSQFGAKGMAEAGYTYEEILKHYYTGVEVR